LTHVSTSRIVSPESSRIARGAAVISTDSQDRQWVAACAYTLERLLERTPAQARTVPRETGGHRE